MTADARPTTATPADTSRPLRPRAGRPFRLAESILLLIVLSPTVTHAAVVSDGRELFNAGKYDECLALCTQETGGDGKFSEGWWLLKARVELTTGKYVEALAT